MFFSRKLTCDKCTRSIPTHKPYIQCQLCEQNYHATARCSYLKPSEVKALIDLNLHKTWFCNFCTNSIFPLALCTEPVSCMHSIFTQPMARQKCHCCSKVGKTLQICDLCENLSHPRCFSGPLGCRTCMQDIIPGFNVNVSEIFCTNSKYTDKIFNPFDRNSDINNIANFDNELGDLEQLTWAPCSNLLEYCKYYEFLNITPSRETELKVLSLNIRSIYVKINTIKDEIVNFSKFDILCFNETGCSILRLPFGGTELKLDTFHPPIIQGPARASNKGGGLIIYVNKNFVLKMSLEFLIPFPKTIILRKANFFLYD